MEITEVRIFLKESPDKKLKAYATVTFDNVFVVRNIKVIEGGSGLFMAMPSRRLKSSCSKCGFRNEMRSKYCNQCGAQLPFVSMPTEQGGKDAQSEHRDIAHPITQTFRECLQKKVLEAYNAEKDKTPEHKSPSPEF
ncbi:MAG: septation protein SpoVG family protein [Candidatus Omnitrophica bacterium]|nr:septation protein SpoVG family protein [Candidatus Omnitrophota bacterium]MDD5355481.1 septation protein SpoVG family protein [Candidatus Omnitrophota bacterium]